MTKQAKYEPKVLRLTAGEAKNGWSPAKLLEWMKQVHGTEYELHAELYRRAKDHEHHTHTAVAKFKRHEDLNDPENQKRLAELEREAAEATADAAHAADRYVETMEAAA